MKPNSQNEPLVKQEARLFLRELSLQNFRKFTKSELQFDPQINYLFGNNGAGKTSVLEAIYFLILGRSFRTASLQDLVRKGSPYFFVEASATAMGMEQNLKAAVGLRVKKIVFNHTPLSSVSQMIGTLHGVAITPDDAQLIKGAPQLRRDFIDLQIAQVDPLFVHHLSRYYKAMNHRNALLRKKQLASIESWEGQMATSAAYITARRTLQVERLSTAATSFFKKLYPQKQAFTLRYMTEKAEEGTPFTADFFQKQWRTMRNKELLVGYTLTGPHKHDLQIELDNLSIKLFSSEGEKKGAVLALKFAEWLVLKEETASAPLLLIDDLSASLDLSRQSALLDLLAACGQVFISSTEAPNHPLLKGKSHSL